MKLIKDNIPFNDDKTHKLMSEGKTLGCFQIDSDLGRTWCAKIKPNDIDELAAIISLIRPGSLKAYSGDPPKSMTQRYCDRKNNGEVVEYLHMALEPIFKDTQGILCYQEQSMKLASDIAGFSLVESDNLRKAIGRKDAELMSKLASQFVEGCTKTGIISEEQAKEVFEWIRKSSRYSFNKCLSPLTTVILQDDSIKTLDELQVGDFILGPYGFVKVLNKFEQGNQPLFEITTDSGKKLECTQNHKLECADGYVRPLCEITNHILMCRNGMEHIVNIRPVGEQRTIDIEVDSEDHLFYANGISTSNSHAVTYAINAYHSAWIKANYPLQFFTAWLQGAQWKQDPLAEIASLVSDAKSFGLEVLPPDIRSTKDKVHIFEGKIRFGIADCKRVGDTALTKIKTAIDNAKAQLNKKLKEFTWFEFLAYICDDIPSSSLTSLISVGALTYFRLSRTRLLFEVSIWDKLTDKEKDVIRDDIKQGVTHSDLESALNRLINGGCKTKKRIPTVTSLLTTLKNPPHSLDDDPNQVIWMEEHYLGAALSYNKIDTVLNSIQVNMTCQQFLNSKVTYSVLGVELKRCNEIVTKNGKHPGQKMAFIDIADSSGIISGAVVFPDVYRSYRHLLYAGNILLMQIEKSGRAGSFIVKRIQQLS